MWKLPALLLVLVACGCSGDDDAGDDDATAGGTAGSSGGGPAGSSSGGTGGSSAGSAGSAGSTGGSAAGSSGSGGKGGSSAGSGGKSGSVVRAAVSLNIVAPSSCSLPAGFLDLPEVAGGHPVTATTKSDTLENDGTTADGGRARVSCMWAEFDGGLFFDGAIQIRAGTSTSTVNLGSMSLNEGQPGEGGLVISGALLPQQYNAPTDSCTLTPIEIDTDANSVWGEIRCPTFESIDGQDVCEIGPSYFYFENCPES